MEHELDLTEHFWRLVCLTFVTSAYSNTTSACKRFDGIFIELNLKLGVGAKNSETIFHYSKQFDIFDLFHLGAFALF